MSQLLFTEANREALDQLTFAATERKRPHGVSRGFQKASSRNCTLRRGKNLANAPAGHTVAATAGRVELSMGHPLLSAHQAESRQRISVARSAQNLLRIEKSPLKFQTLLVFGCEGVAVPSSRLFERSGLRAGLFLFGACFPPSGSEKYIL